jgi:hypothetical protein
VVMITAMMQPPGEEMIREVEANRERLAKH